MGYNSMFSEEQLYVLNGFRKGTKYAKVGNFLPNYVSFKAVTHDIL